MTAPLTIRPLLLGMALLASAPAHAVDLAKLEAQAQGDPKKADKPAGKLVGALDHRDPATATGAADALVRLGQVAVPALKRSVEKGKPEAEESLVVLARMGERELLEWVDRAGRAAGLEAAALAAIPFGEEPLWGRIERSPELGDCQAYLHLYPQGRWAEQVSTALRELEARIALSALSTPRQPKDLELLVERWDGTAAAQDARKELGQHGLVTATQAMAKQQFEEALEWVRYAALWDPQAQTRAMEASILHAWGTFEVRRESWKNARDHLMQAYALGADCKAELGQALFENAETLFREDQFLEGMLDVHRARAVAPTLLDDLRDLALREGRRALQLLEYSPQRRPGTVIAVSLSGPDLRRQLAAFVWGTISRGEGWALDEVVAVMKQPDVPADVATWAQAVLEQAITSTDSQLRQILGDAAMLNRLLDPVRLWRGENRLEYDNAASASRAYRVAVQATQAWKGEGRRLSGPVPSEAPMTRDQVVERLTQGADVLDPSLPLILRAQILEVVLGAGPHVRELARQEPAMVMALMVGQPEAPRTVADWAVIYVKSEQLPRTRRYLLPYGDGSLEIGTQAQGPTLQVVVDVQQGGGRVGRGLAGSLFNAFMLAARPMMYCTPGIERLELLAGPTVAEGGVEPNLRVALGLGDVLATNWDLVDRKVPLSVDDLDLVPERLWVQPEP